MAWRVSAYLIEGELDNTQPGKVAGWMKFAGIAREVVFDLTGDFHRDIQGARIRIVGEANPQTPDAFAYMKGFAAEQRGKAGDITAGLPPTDYVDYPYIEWYSEENGRVVIELDRDHIEVIGRPIPVKQAILAARKEQAANLKEFMDTVAARMERPSRQSAAGAERLPPVGDIAVMPFGRREDEGGNQGLPGCDTTVGRGLQDVDRQKTQGPKGIRHVGATVERGTGESPP